MKDSALRIVNSPRKKRTVSIEQSFDSKIDSEETYTVQYGVLWPEQEEVVFRKQLLQHCSALPPEEAALMSLAFDRATMEEMILELGISKSELVSRRASVMRKMMRKAAA